jgi:hypothetical protein
MPLGRVICNPAMLETMIREWFSAVRLVSMRPAPRNGSIRINVSAVVY